MSVKYGLNQFKNSSDESTSVTIDDGKLRELGVPLGEVNEFINGIYIVDTMGRKNLIPLHHAIIQSLSLMSDEMKNSFKNSIFGDIDILPSNITSVVPFILTDSDLGSPTDFIIYGKNMFINDTNKTSITLIDKENDKKYCAISWSPINENQIQASFKIPKSTISKTLYVSVKLGDVDVQSSAEIIINKSISYENQVIEFTKFGDENFIETSADKITFSPLFNNDIGADSVSVISNDIDGTKNFILSADLSINTRTGSTLNSIDLTRSGFGLGSSGGNGEIRFDGVNLDLWDFKPRFNTFQTKDNIKHIKFIKQGRVLYKILYSETSVYTYKTILTDLDNISICASMQKLDEAGNIQSVSYSNIKLKTY